MSLGVPHYLLLNPFDYSSRWISTYSRPCSEKTSLMSESLLGRISLGRTVARFLLALRVAADMWSRSGILWGEWGDKMVSFLSPGLRFKYPAGGGRLRCWGILIFPDHSTLRLSALMVSSLPSVDPEEASMAPSPLTACLFSLISLSMLSSDLASVDSEYILRISLSLEVKNDLGDALRLSMLLAVSLLWPALKNWPLFACLVSGSYSSWEELEWGDFDSKEYLGDALCDMDSDSDSKESPLAWCVTIWHWGMASSFVSEGKVAVEVRDRDWMFCWVRVTVDDALDREVVSSSSSSMATGNCLNTVRFFRHKMHIVSRVTVLTYFLDSASISLH